MKTLLIAILLAPLIIIAGCPKPTKERIVYRNRKPAILTMSESDWSEIQTSKIRNP